MAGLDSLEGRGDLALHVGALEQEAARRARAQRAQVRLFNENFAQSRAYWRAVRRARR
jgi:hypothetical protein